MTLLRTAFEEAEKMEMDVSFLSLEMDVKGHRFLFLF